MKVIVYERNAFVEVARPLEGARLAFAIKDENGTDICRSATPVPVDSFMRRWPVSGLTAEWAETEDEFLQRIIKKDVPSDATKIQIIDSAQLPSRKYRNAWRLP